MAGSAFGDQRDPALPELFSALANAPDPMASYEVEQTIWSAWLEAPDEVASVLLEEGRSAAMSGAMHAALQSFDELTEKFPDYAEGWNQRAIVHFMLGDLQRSLADIARTLELEPRHFGALSGSGQCYFRLEMYREALGAFEAALQVHPWLPAARRQVEILRALVKDETTPI